MKVFSILLFVVSAGCVAQTLDHLTQAKQTSSGSCSPNIINQGSGKVTFSCNGVDPRLLREFNGGLQKFLSEYPNTNKRLNELLDKKDIELAAKVQEVQEWIDRYKQLSLRLAAQPADDEISKQANYALKRGDLDQAESLLKTLLIKEENQVDQTARNHFNLGDLYRLRFQPLLAWPEYSKAYQYRPQEFSYAFAYATVLYQQNRYSDAEKVYLATLELARKRPAAGSDYFRYIATTQNNLAILYSNTQRLSQAEAAYKDCLSTYRRLAEDKPGTYTPYVVGTLNNLAALYSRTQRLREAEDAFDQCLTTYRQLPKESALSQLSGLANTLNNLGIIYSATQRTQKADNVLNESLTIFQKLADESPIYLSNVADVLANYGELYSKLDRSGDAEKVFNRSLAIYQDLAKENSGAYSQQLGKAWNNLGIFYVTVQRPSLAEGAFKKSIEIRRQLAKDHPGAYQQDVASTLSSLGSLSINARKFDEAEGPITESLAIYQGLAKENPAAYEPHVANTLNNLGWLYDSTNRREKAEIVYKQSVSMYKQLTKKNPAVYIALDTRTSNNLGALYRNSQRPKEAEALFLEGLDLRRDLFKGNPSLFGDALTVHILNLLLVSTQDNAHNCSLAKEAAQAAVTPEMKNPSEVTRVKLCGTR